MEEIKNLKDEEIEKKEDKKDVEKVVEKDLKQVPKQNTNTTNKKAEEAKNQPNSTNRKEVIDVVKVKTTQHTFDPEEEVYVAEFKNMRDNSGYTKIENQFRFSPLKATIKEVIISMESGKKVVRYKIKNKVASLYDEEDVCATLKEAELLCKEKNK